MEGQERQTENTNIIATGNPLRLVETEYEYIQKDAVMWGFLSVFLLGLSCFLIGLTSFDDTIDFGNQRPKFISSWFGSQNLTTAPHVLVKLASVSFTNSLQRSLAAEDESQQLLKGSDVAIHNTTVTTIQDLVDLKAWWWRAVLDLSLLWLVNGFAGLIVGIYLWGRFGRLLLSSESLDIILPQSSPDVERSALQKLGSLFRQHIVRRGTRMYDMWDSRFGMEQIRPKINIPMKPDEVMFIGDHQGAIRALRDEEMDAYLHNPDFDVPIVCEKNEFQNGHSSSNIDRTTGPQSIERLRGNFPDLQRISGTPSSYEESLIDDPDISYINSSAKQIIQVQSKATGLINLEGENSDLTTMAPGTIHGFVPRLVPILGGLGLAASQAALKVGFWCPPIQWPSITMLSGCDGIIVELIFIYWFNVRPNRPEAILFIMMFCGACLIPLLGWSVVDLDGLLCGTIAAACMAASVAFTRIGAFLGVSGFTGFSTRSLTQGLVGVFGLLIMVIIPQGRSYLIWSFTKNHGSDWPRVVAIPVAAGTCAALSVAALNLALRYRKSSALSGILPLHSLIVTLLCWIVFGAVPILPLWVGFILIWLSCVLLPLSKSMHHLYSSYPPLLPATDNPYSPSVSADSSYLPIRSRAFGSLSSKHFSPFSFQVPSVHYS